MSIGENLSEPLLFVLEHDDLDESSSPSQSNGGLQSVSEYAPFLDTFCTMSGRQIGLLHQNCGACSFGGCLHLKQGSLVAPIPVSHDGRPELPVRHFAEDWVRGPRLHTVLKDHHKSRAGWTLDVRRSIVYPGRMLEIPVTLHEYDIPQIRWLERSLQSSIIVQYLGDHTLHTH